MRRSRASHVIHRQPNWLLVCAMLALSVHALANMGLMPARGQSANGVGDAFFAQICTGRGALPRGPDVLGQAFADAATQESEWCELCSLASGPALPHAEPPPALEVEPAVHLALSVPLAPAHAEWASQSPRGPPLLG